MASAAPGKLLVVAHPSPDVYGSDRQLLETIDAVVEAGWSVTVYLPDTGPLVPLLRERGATVVVEDYPVLRKSLMRPLPFLRYVARSVVSIVRLSRRLRRQGAGAVYVNTVTIPVWLAAARLARVPALTHVHEAEEDQPKLVRAALASPMLLARDVIVNSGAARQALVDVLPRLDRRIAIVHNGVPGPAVEPAPARVRQAGDPARLALVGRLSPRKGTDVALEALALLLAEGRDVTLTVCGSVFAGYEWFEAELREHAAQPDLAGRVDFAGYVNPTWPVLADADVVLVPSRVEPFGNAAVEGLLARRPVVASGVQGLKEVIVADRTGLLVPPGEPAALAVAIAGLLDDPARAARIAEAGFRDAHDRFSLGGYADKIRESLRRTVR